MSSPHHHLDDDLLLDYASGAASAPVSLVVACHLTLCAACRERLVSAERVGGALLETAPAADLAPDALERLWSRIDGGGPAANDSAPAGGAGASQPQTPLTIDGVTFPSPLRRHLIDDRGATRRLRFIAPGIRGVDLSLPPSPGVGDSAARTRLVRLAPGLVIPHHAHGGDEYTLVLSGSFEDADGRYARGDLRLRATGEEHVQKIARNEACFALTVNEGALIPRSWHAKVLSLLFDRS